MSIGDFYVCPNCGGKQGFHNLPCSGTVGPIVWPFSGGQPLKPGDPGYQPPILTETDVRRIVLDVLEMVETVYTQAEMHSIFEAIDAIRKEMNTR